MDHTTKCIIKSEVPHFSFKSSLVLAVRNNDTTLLTFLLNIRTSPDGHGWTALMRGSFNGRDKAVNLLVDAKANPNPDVMVSQLCTWQPRMDTLKSSIFFSESKPISTFQQMMVPHL